jgi:hypothetical protein
VFFTVCELFVSVRPHAQSGCGLGFTGRRNHEHSVQHSFVCMSAFNFRLAHEPFVNLSRGQRRGERRGGVKGRDETVSVNMINLD